MVDPAALESMVLQFYTDLYSSPDQVGSSDFHAACPLLNSEQCVSLGGDHLETMEADMSESLYGANPIVNSHKMAIKTQPLHLSSCFVPRDSRFRNNQKKGLTNTTNFSNTS